MNKKLVKWFAHRGAEFQFGRTIFGWFQFIYFLPLYFKAFHLTFWQIIIISILGCILSWLPGWLAYRTGYYEYYQRKQFQGIIGEDKNVQIRLKTKDK